MSQAVKQLYFTFQPQTYDLSLEINDSALAFSGQVIILGRKIGRPSKRITLHSKGLKIQSAQIIKHDKNGDQTIEISRINLQKSYDEVRLHTDQLLYPGNYTVKVDFEGSITRNMEGIYPCFFKDAKGQEQKLIATQFESHHAREAFPCIDEPAAKAVFNLTLKTGQHKAILGNTPVKEQSSKDGQVVTSFEPTPKMSTYLLAFAFGNMDYLESKTKNGTLVRSYATPANTPHTQFALETAVKCLDFYNDYFAIDYPLPKCDFVALPDFASGAMENWGLITFREQALLVDPANTSLSMKQYVANVVAHELTHQWFGNLVTMQWWNDLWLNESFASWMSYLAVDHLFPDWQVWTQFIADEQSLALGLDALEYTHPIQVPIKHPDEIRSIFDAISYEKGASVLHMLHGWIGADAFRDGLRLYLSKHAYANTTADDLWAAWEQVSGQPVGQFMHTWISQPGYPLVRYIDKAVSQERFYLNPAAQKETAVWPVPLLPSAGAGQVLNSASQPLDLADGAVLNSGRTAFNRVVYGANHLATIDVAKLSELDRLGLLADSFASAKAGYSPTVDALKLLESYAQEDNVVVWDTISGALSSLRLVMNDELLRDNMKSYVQKLTAKQLRRLGWKESATDSHFDKLLRPTILALAAAADEPAVVEEALKRFNSMQKPEDIHPDIRGIVYGTAARLGGQKEFDKLWQMHNYSTNSEERVTLSAALTGFEKPAQITQALEKIISPDVRLQDAMYWVAYSFMNRYARAETWQWVQDNWQWLKDNLGDDLSFHRMPMYVARVQSDPKFLNEYKTFFDPKRTPAINRTIDQGIETIQWQSAWRQRDLSAVKKYFQ